MRLLTFISSLFAASTVVMAYEAPKELDIKTTFMPEGCTVKAQTGDSIQVHYTGTLHSNGNKFDSSHDRGSPLPLTRE